MVEKPPETGVRPVQTVGKPTCVDKPPPSTGVMNYHSHKALSLTWSKARPTSFEPCISLEMISVTAANAMVVGDRPKPQYNISKQGGSLPILR